MSLHEGTNFVVHGTLANGGSVSYGPFNTYNTAMGVAGAAMSDGTIVDYYITYTNTSGGEVDLREV